MKKEKGNIGNLLATGLCILAMTVVTMVYMEKVSLIYAKWEVVQLARKYILCMETCGYLMPEDETGLTDELEELGISDINLGGSTVRQVGYGEEIVLEIRGKIEGEYDFWEKRVSTAKH